MSAKKLKIKYGDSVFALPRENVMLSLQSAREFELKVLLIAAADDSLRNDYDSACEKICKQLDCTKTALGRALDFWRRAGVMDAGDATVLPTADNSSAPASTKTLQSFSLPTYTESQTADAMEKHSALKGIIDSCQQIVGKIFTPAETASIVCLYDYLKLSDPGYIETLYSYCKANGKTSPRYIEKVALTMHDEDVSTTAQLSEYIEQRAHRDEIYSGFKSIIGTSRSLTAREKQFVDKWADEWKMSMDVVKRAYEATVDSIGSYKIAYMNRIIENWYNSGLTTLSLVEASLEQYRRSKADAEKTGSGFETDEYFEAAVANTKKHLKKSESGT